MNSDVNILLLPLCFLGLYMILEAADWGLSLAAPLISRNRQENEAILNLMKPGLDGNELWFFMGLFMIQMAFPLTGESLTAGTVAVVVLVVLGALLRLFAVLAKKYFSSPLAIKIMSILPWRRWRSWDLPVRHSFWEAIRCILFLGESVQSGLFFLPFKSDVCTGLSR